MVNWLGVYGTPAMIRVNGGERIKYETEFVAAAHIYDPLAARFIPAPPSPRLTCCLCGKRKPHASFDVDTRNTRRGGRRSECKECRARERKLERMARRQKKREARDAA